MGSLHLYPMQRAKSVHMDASTTCSGGKQEEQVNDAIATMNAGIISAPMPWKNI
jgi:hypothetical protein